ncbi:MAG: rod shape-determining protein MreC [Planctomycetota bacterium]|jgi:rod shape-determining protein MreC|nr:rod shape-determining protein MreC [Planctomycetota bacterium]
MRRRAFTIILLFLLAAAWLTAAWRPELTARVKLALVEFWQANLPTAAAPETIDPDAQIRLLNQRLAQKDAEIFALEQTLAEFEHFRRLLPNVQMVAAQTIERSFFSDEVTINAGARDGVRAGDAAAQGAVLAGVVGLAGETASAVLLTSHPGCVVPARAGNSREICMVRGAGNERATVIFYSGQTAVAPGEKIFTSGLLGKLPAGLLIGTVENFPLRGKEPGTMEARVKLDANFAALEYLLVVAQNTIKN